jgi:menaquinone-dependent protoporphyrinogen oxidase
METVIIYCSSHGTTEKVAHLLAKKLAPLHPLVVDLRVNPELPLSQFERVIIGGSIHTGQMQSLVKRFCAHHLQELLQKELSLFICCLQQEKEQEQFEHAYPSQLREHSRAQGCFGGELLPDRLSFWQKMLLKAAGKDLNYTSQLNLAAINRFAARLLAPPLQNRQMASLK